VVLAGVPPAVAQVTVPLGSLDAGETVVVRYRVTVDPSNTIPAGTSVVSSRATVTADDEDAAVAALLTRPLVIVDSDGDGVGDDVDECPSDPGKAVPGSCGCFQPDLDLNANQVADCLVNPDLKREIALALAAVDQLVPKRTVKKDPAAFEAQEAVKRELTARRDGIQAIIGGSLEQIVVTDPEVRLPKLEKKARRSMTKALKTGGGLKKKKKKATKTLTRLDEAIR
jgi:hypothetical protein